MKRFVFGIIVVTIFASCSLPDMDEFVYEPVDITSDMAISDGFYTYDSAWRWVVNNIYYADDSVVWGRAEYWQTPTETYDLRSGDCEDSAILLIHLWNKLGYPANLALVSLSSATTGYDHAVVELYGVLYSSQSYPYKYTVAPRIDKIIKYQDIGTYMANKR